MMSDYDGPIGEHTPPGIWTGIAVVDRHLADIAARDQLVAELRRDLADLTKQNDRLQDEHAADLCHIDQLEATLRAVREIVAEMRGAR